MLTKETRSKLNRLATKAKLVDVLMVNSMIKRRRQSFFDPPTKDWLVLKPRISGEHHWAKTEQELLCFVRFDITGDVEEEQEIEIDFELMARYNLDEQDPDQEILALYATHHTPFTVYPFARELVANLTTRMGGMRLILPLWEPRPDAPASKAKT